MVGVAQRALLALGLVLVAAGCGSTAEEAPGARLQASSAAVLFEEAVVGQQREGSVLVLNAGSVPRTVHFRSDSPAFTPPGPLELPAQGYREVRVRFTPPDAGTFQGLLRVESEDGEALEVALLGAARPAPTCRALGPCRTARLDTASMTCVHDTVPDGTACGQGACGGVCEAGTCVTDSGALSAAWSYAQPANKALRFPGVVDAEGSVYWFEYARGTAGEACELVSASREGLPRYRVALGTANCASTQAGTLLLAGDALVLGVLGQPEWHRRSDGGLLWRPQLAPALAQALGVEPTALLGSVVQALAASRDGQVYGLVSTATQQQRATLLVDFDPAQQQALVLARFEEGFSPTHLVLDNKGQLYVGDAALRELRVLDTRGSLRWRSAYGGVPRATWSDRVWTDAGNVLDAYTGKTLYARALRDPAALPSPVGGEALAFAWAQASTGGAQLTAIDVLTGQARWTFSAPQPSATLYTTRDSVLLPTRDEWGAGGLLELGADGLPVQAAGLCGKEAVRGDWALHAGRVFALTAGPEDGGTLQLRAYDLHNPVAPASRGWAAEYGDLGRASAAR